MTKLQQCLYEYIEDERLPALQSDGEYLLARSLWEDAKGKLFAELNDRQKQAFDSFMDAEIVLDSVSLQYIFRETLTLVPTLLHISL